MQNVTFEFTPQFKLVIAGNHKPGLRCRRFNLIPFIVHIPPEERDENLTEKLKAEWPGILAWMIEGCLEWQRDGLKPPQVVLTATAEYLESEDALTAWIEDKCERSPQSWTSSTDLFLSWKHWADIAGEPSGTQKRFSQKLEERGFDKERNRDGRGFRGLRITLNTVRIDARDTCDGSLDYRLHARANGGYASTCHIRHKVIRYGK